MTRTDSIWATRYSRGMSHTTYRIITPTPIKVNALVIGAGPAGLAASKVLSGNGIDFKTIESGPPISQRDRRSPKTTLRGAGGAGLYSDGKFSFYPSASNYWKLRNKNLVEESFDWSKTLFQTYGLEVPLDPSASEAQSGEKEGFKIYPSTYLSIEKRTQLIHDLSDSLRKFIEYGASLLSLQKQEDQTYLATVETASGITTYRSKYIIFCGGRFGPKELTKAYPFAPFRFRRFEVGVRVQQPSESFIFSKRTELDIKHVDRISEDTEWRTFCTCRNGETVYTEWDQIETFSGRADGAKSEFTNFGLNIRFTSVPGREIEKELTSIVNGNTNTFEISWNDFINRTGIFLGKNLDRLLESKIKSLFGDEIENLELIGPCIEGVGFYPDIDGNLKLNSNNIWVAGDASGIFRGLTAAFMSGYYSAATISNITEKPQALPSYIKSSDASPMPVAFTAQSKAFFYCRDAVCEFTLKQNYLPVNPFRVFEYFLGDRVDRNVIRRGNNQLINSSDELWVFGPIADGVLFEIVRARTIGKPVRFFNIATKFDEIHPIGEDELTFEPEVHARQIPKDELISLVIGENVGGTGKLQLFLDFQ